MSHRHWWPGIIHSGFPLYSWKIEFGDPEGPAELSSELFFPTQQTFNWAYFSTIITTAAKTTTELHSWHLASFAFQGVLCCLRKNGQGISQSHGWSCCKVKQLSGNSWDWRKTWVRFFFLFKIFFFFYLQGIVNREREMFYLLCYSPNVPSSLDWAKLKPGASSTSPM